MDQRFTIGDELSTTIVIN